MFQEKHVRCNIISVTIKTPENQLLLEHVISVNKYGKVSNN